MFNKKILGVYNIKGDIVYRQIAPEYMVPIPPKPEGATRFVCISDTHESKIQLDFIPDGDVLLHAGDFTYKGGPSAVKEFNDWLGTLPHKHKVVIAGNHDVTFDIPFYNRKWQSYTNKKLDPMAVKNSLTNCIYLEDSEITVCGFRIYGSPWQPEFCDWAFNVIGQEAIKKYWDLIPTGIDVLMTHGPPLGHGGLCQPSRHDAGCPELLKAIKRTKPLVHVAGHIHEGYGVSKVDGTVCVNASTVNYHYKVRNNPVVFDMI